MISHSDALCTKLCYDLWKFKETWSKNVSFFSIITLSTQKCTLRKLSLLTFSQGCFFFLSYFIQIFREAQSYFNVSGPHEGQICLKDFDFALNKKGTFQCHKNLQRTKNHPSYQFMVPLMAGRFLLLSSLAERDTLSHAVRMGYDNGITSFSWAVRLNYLLKERKRGRKASHLDTDIAWVISGFYQETIQQLLL